VIVGDENKSEVINTLVRNLRKLRSIEETKDVAVILIHHFRKSEYERKGAQELRGSSDIAAMADCAYATQKLQEDRIIFKAIKPSRSFGLTDSFFVNLEEDEKEIKISCELYEEEMEEVEKCLSELLFYCQMKGITQFRRKEVLPTMETKGFSRRTIDRSFRLGMEKGFLIKPKRGVYQIVQQPLPKKETERQQTLTKEQEKEIEEAIGIESKKVPEILRRG
jgi:hypothetical protein